MSLWPAPDRTTSQLMINFYKNISQGMAKDQALYRAKIDYLNKADNIGANPFYWGSFVFIGNPQPIQFNRPFFKQWWFFGLLVLVVVGVVVTRKMKYLNHITS